MKITAQEFDKKFDNYEDFDEFIDYKTPISLNEFKNKYLKDKVELTFKDTIKVLLARELQVI